MRIDSVIKLEKIQKECHKENTGHPIRVHICCGPGCLASGALEISERFKQLVTEKKLKNFKIEAIKETGCHGFCEKGPLVVIEPEGTFYTKVKPKDIEEIIDKTLGAGEVIERLLVDAPTNNHKIQKYQDVPFYANQTRIALRNLGHIDQTSLPDYLATGGYSGMAKALTTMKPKEVIEEVTASGLRGRGGGGFSAGRKWATCAREEADERFVICNGDEGDPGAFMDRAIMEGDPHSVLEGMIICAFAVGSSRGYVYVREEYPLAVVHLEKAIADAEAHGLLGDNILGTDFSFSISVNRGAGAFVCGESSALMKSVAGEIGEPRAKYIRSVVKGLWDKPTVLNNVETFANIAVIIDKGSKWFSGIGTRKSTGTKAFSLVGKVKNTGLIEVPMGMTLRQIIYDIGGGVPDGKSLKAVQTGGPSGGCLPETKLDLPVDFDSLTEAGSMMGSGGMIVMDESTCVVDLAKYFLAFLVEESCGKCLPCREGLYQLHKSAERISEGRGNDTDLASMEKLSNAVAVGSLCGLGKSGPNPFLSTVQYFRSEYEEHIHDKKCTAGVCRELITYEITDKCTGCLACIPACPTGAITGEKGKVHQLDQDNCDRCNACYAVCTYDAIVIH